MTYNRRAMNDFLERYRWLLFLVLALPLAAGVLIFAWRQPASDPIQIILVAPTAVPTPGPIRVYISGAVRQPDVYTLPPDSIVKDGLAAAGGPAPDADLARINLAQPLSDGQQIVVPRQGEALSSNVAPAPAVSNTASGLLNINTASAQELEALPGIGPALAQSIVSYRNEHGPFQSIDDLKNVPGIGDARFERLKGLITVGP